MRILALTATLGFIFLTGCANTQTMEIEEGHSVDSISERPQRGLGAFSVSLSVQDIAKSKAFYEKLGFTQIHGVQEQNWVIMQHGTTTIGLFQGMFPRNSLTFNPGWNSDQETPDSFVDVREIQKHLKEAGLTLTTEADMNSTGPANFTLIDPDGNPILFDQHVPKPKQP